MSASSVLPETKPHRRATLDSSEGVPGVLLPRRKSVKQHPEADGEGGRSLHEGSPERPLTFWPQHLPPSPTGAKAENKNHHADDHEARPAGYWIVIGLGG